MPYYFFVWDPDRDEKLELNGVEKDDFEQVVQNPASVVSNRSSSRMIAFGYSADNRWLAFVYEQVDEDTILPITAYFPEEE